MNAWLGALESIDNQWLPPLLLVAGLLLALYFIYSTLKGRGASRRREVNTMNSETNESLLSSALSLQAEWKAKPDYSTVLSNSVQTSKDFPGWFTVEENICSGFKNKIAGIGEGVEKYPETELEYLQIVSEIQRAPKPWWMWTMLVVMMVAEAYGFSVLLAGYMNDRGSALDDDRLAIVFCFVIASVLLYFAYRTGSNAYKQAYARRVWKDSDKKILCEVDEPDGSSVPKGKTLAATAADNNLDQLQRQATRMANRSAYVETCAAETKGSSENNKVRAFTTAFWIYVVVVFICGVLLVTVRTGAINQSHEREWKRVVAMAASEATTAERTSSGMKPDVVDGQNAAAATAVTQESLEQTRETKIVVTYVYGLLFWVVQAAALLITAQYGFASDSGEMAYKKIRAFRSRHGDVLIGEYDERLTSARLAAAALASATLKAWQLGLQTEYSKSNPENLDGSKRRIIEDALKKSSDRTYKRYVALTDAPIHFEPKTVAPEQQVAIAISPPPPVAAAQVAMYQPAAEVEIQVEFYERGTNGEEAVQLEVLRQLKVRVAETELDVAKLMVRLAGQPGRYFSYKEFLQVVKGTQA